MEERPEKCPIETCEYHIKGFARKYDKNRHALTHYKGTMVCPFCPGAGTAYEKAFNRADVFKRHLTAVHNVEQTPPNSRKLAAPAGGRPGGAAARCNICQSQFATAQEFYEHLDDCVLNVIVPSTPKTAGSGSGSATARKDSSTRTPTTASTDKGKDLDTEMEASDSREPTQPQADPLDVSMEREHSADHHVMAYEGQTPASDSAHAGPKESMQIDRRDQLQLEEQRPEHQPASPENQPIPHEQQHHHHQVGSVPERGPEPGLEIEVAIPNVLPPKDAAMMEVEQQSRSASTSHSEQSNQPPPSGRSEHPGASDAKRQIMRPEVTLGSPAPDLMDTDM
jgi:hypothetical protein